MAKIKFDFVDLDTAPAIVRYKQIHAALSGNAAFPGVAAKLPPFLEAVVDLEDLNKLAEAAEATAKEKRKNVEDQRVEVDNLARALASGCEMESTGEAALLSGGWVLRGAAAPVGPLPAPVNLHATGGDLEGEVDLLWPPVNGRHAYIAEHAPGPNGPWTQFYVAKKSSCTASGLTSAQVYWFRVRAVGAAGPGPWSDPAQTRAT